MVDIKTKQPEQGEKIIGITSVGAMNGSYISGDKFRTTSGLFSFTKWKPKKSPDNKPLFKKGEIYTVRFFREGRGYVTGDYELIRKGKRYYLFCAHSGHDWYPTEKGLQDAIEEYKNNPIL